MSTVSLAEPQGGLLWLVTVIFNVAVPTLDRVTVGSSAVASEKVTTRSEGLLESTVQRILPLDAVAAIRKDRPSSSHFFWSGPAAAVGVGLTASGPLHASELMPCESNTLA